MKENLVANIVVFVLLGWCVSTFFIGMLCQLSMLFNLSNITCVEIGTVFGLIMFSFLWVLVDITDRAKNK